MSDKITQADIAEVVTSMAAKNDERLLALPERELGAYWHFNWDYAKSREVNMYDFFSSLKLYEFFCRRWEEHYNGISCVVERTRDKYLMPKIREFVRRLDTPERAGGGMK